MSIGTSDLSQLSDADLRLLTDAVLNEEIGRSGIAGRPPECRVTPCLERAHAGSMYCSAHQLPAPRTCMVTDCFEISPIAPYCIQHQVHRRPPLGPAPQTNAEFRAAGLAYGAAQERAAASNRRLEEAQDAFEAEYTCVFEWSEDDDVVNDEDYAAPFEGSPFAQQVARQRVRERAELEAANAERDREAGIERWDF